MDKQRGLIFKTGLILLFLLQVITALQITKVRVPSSYSISRNESESKPLILGCDYDIEDDVSKGFVLKWKHNDLQFYQWIPSRNPIVFSSFKGHIDVDYYESDDRLHKHSVLKFINPMANYTGNYTCQVSTFDELVSSTAHLQIIVPETDFSLGFQRETNGSTVVFCNVGEIYPLPDVALRIDDEKVSDAVAFEQMQEYTGYYNVSVQYILPDPDKNLQLQCDVTIPATDYSLHSSMPYQGKLPSEEGKIITNEENTITNEEQTIANEEKPIFVEEKTISDEEKTVLNEQKTLSDDEKTILNEEKTILNEEKTILNEEKTLSDEEKTISNVEKTIANEEKTILNEEKNILNEEKTILNEEKPIFVEEKTISDEEKTVLNVEKTIVNEEKTIANEEKTIANEEKTILNEENPIFVQEKTISDEEKTVLNEEKTILNEEKTLSDEEKSI